MVKTSCVPTPFKGFSSSLRTEGLTKAPPRTSTISGSRKRTAMACEIKPAPTNEPIVPEYLLGLQHIGGV
jgi:hypothetical protein